MTKRRQVFFLLFPNLVLNTITGCPLPPDKQRSSLKGNFDYMLQFKLDVHTDSVLNHMVGTLIYQRTYKVILNCRITNRGVQTATHLLLDVKCHLYTINGKIRNF